MELLSHNLSEVLAVSIIHSLWQCLLIYLLLRILLADILHLSAAAKHYITFAAMLISACWFVYTLFDQASNYSWQISTNGPVNFRHLPLIAALKNATVINDHYVLAIERYLPFISIVYLCGILLQSVKLTFSWLHTRELKKQGKTDPLWQQKLNQLSGRLNIKKIAAILITDKIKVPCITGYLRPIILMPISLSSYLSVKEIEAILLHELAHVKRNDYLISLLQQVIMVILFFNPFILLMDRIINREREHSCDDLVVKVTESPLVYAQALLKIQQNNVEQWTLALAATGKKFHLLNRIERIMKTKKPEANIRQMVMALLILTISITCVAWLNPAIGHGKISVKKIKPELEAFFADTSKTGKKAARAGATRKRNAEIRHRDHIKSSGELNDPQLEKLSAEAGKYGEELGKYYDGPEFKEMQEKMSAIDKDMQSFQNNEQLKKLQEEQENLGRSIDKWADDPETHKISNRMDALGKTIDTYYSSTEFTELNARLEKKYGIPHDRPSDYEKGENYKKYEEELKQHTPANVKAATQEIGKLGEQIRSHYNSPEFKAATERMKLIGDSLRKAFDNPQFKQQQEEMRKLGQQMSAYAKSPKAKELQKQMKEAQARLRAYTHSPVFKKQMEEFRKQAENFKNNALIEQPEPPEQPEHPEQPEQPDVKL